MKFFKEPKQFEEEEWEHLVIGYFHGKAIVKDENGHLFFLKCEEAAAHWNGASERIGRADREVEQQRAGTDRRNLQHLTGKAGAR